MTGNLLSRANQFAIVASAVCGCAVSSATAVGYVAVRDHQVSENTAEIAKLKIVIPVVQTNLAVVQAQLDDIQTILNRIDERSARRERQSDHQ